MNETYVSPPISDSRNMSALSVLIIEDEWLNADLIGMLAQDCGCQVAGVAHSVAAATSLAESTGANLALVDIQLGGGVDGITFAATLRATYGMRIAFMTGAGDAETIKRIEAFAPLAVILKPFNAQQLQDVLDLAAASV